MMSVTIKKGAVIRKSFVLLSLALVLCVCTLSWGKASAQPSDDQLLIPYLIEGSDMQAQINAFMMDEELGEIGITQEQRVVMREKMAEIFNEVFIAGMEKQFGEWPPAITRENFGDVTDFYVPLTLKLNDAARKALTDTLHAETVKRLDIHAFQKLGGVLGGALNVDNLATLNLTDEQREKVTKIAEKLHRERSELMFSVMIDRKPGEVPDEEMKEMHEKIVSLARRGQGEIEALLTDAQKKRAAELMAEVPEKYRFMSDYLANRPWRLDESNWKPGDGAPPNLENYPGETRPERPPSGRPFPGQ